MQSKNTASIKVKLRTNRTNAQGEHPIIIRITKDCKSSILSLGYNVLLTEWDNKDKEVKKSHRQQLKINKEIRDIKAELSEIMMRYKDSKINYSSADLINAYLNGIGPKETAEIGMLEYYQVLDKRMLANCQFKTRETYLAALGWVKKYLKISDSNGKADIPLNDVNYTFLLDLLTYIRSEYPEIKGATLFCYFKNYKAIKNKAKKEGKCKVEKCDLYKFSLSQFDTEVPPRYISIESLKKIEALEFPKYSGLWNAKNYFLFSFYSLGMNLIDMALLTWGKIDNVSTKYKRRKTGTTFDFSTNSKCLDIINHYRGLRKSSLVFPILKEEDLDNIENYEKYKNKQKYINQTLKKIAAVAGITEKLTFYSARHGFAQGCKENNVPVEFISEFFGHSDMRVTAKYLKKFSNTTRNKMAESFYAAI